MPEDVADLHVPVPAFSKPLPDRNEEQLRAQTVKQRERMPPGARRKPPQLDPDLPGSVAYCHREPVVSPGVRFSLVPFNDARCALTRDPLIQMSKDA
eukprot:12534403-Alexandrium_andersonii.AAC.1